MSSGQVVAGNVGTEARYEYTVIGTAVNEASRLTEVAKGRAVKVLASAESVRRASGEAGRWHDVGHGCAAWPVDADGDLRAGGRGDRRLLTRGGADRRSLAAGARGRARAGSADSVPAMEHAHLLDLPPDELLARARRVRDSATGTRVTYSPKVFIPLTMLCRDRCGYCTFAQPPARLDSPYLAPDEVLAIARAGARPAATRPCSPWASAPEERYPAAAGVAGRARLRLDRRLPGGHVPRSCSTRPACSPTPTPAPCTPTSWPPSGRSRRARG